MKFKVLVREFIIHQKEEERKTQLRFHNGLIVSAINLSKFL